MKVLITGITGFIGSELARKLLVKDYEVIGLVRHAVGRDFESIEEIKDDLTLIPCDIKNYHSVKSAIAKAAPDVVMHLAALSPVRLSFEQPLDYQSSTYLGTVNVAEAIRELYGNDKVRLIIASTAEVYGIQEPKPAKEDWALNPSSPYAVAKAGSDMYIRMLFRVYNFNGVILRNSNTFGRKYDPSFFTEYLITKMIAREDIYIGAPDSVRDYMYLDDHVNSYILAMEKENAKGEVFNIAGDKGFTNKEWTTKIAELMNFPLKKIHFGEYPPGYPVRPLSSDQPYLVLDTTKAQDILGWSQTVSVDDGLKRIIKYLKKDGNV